MVLLTARPPEAWKKVSMVSVIALFSTRKSFP